jgi:hypothetical protein
VHHDRTSLKTSVREYATAARGQLKGADPTTARRWAVFSTAAGSALGFAASAACDIVYSGPQNVMITLPNPGFYSASNFAPINVDFAGGPELELRLHYSTFFGVDRTGFAQLNGLGAGAFLRGPGEGPFGTVNVRRLASGDVISAGAGAFVGVPAGGNYAYGNLAVQDSQNTFNYGLWQFDGKITGFAGFRFTQGGNNHFGWIRLTIEDTDDIDRTPDKLTAVDWAYENRPDTAIEAGATPEPTSLALMSLALGAGGVMALRRRRQLAKAQAEKS